MDTTVRGVARALVGDAPDYVAGFPQDGVSTTESIKRSVKGGVWRNMRS